MNIKDRLIKIVREIAQNIEKSDDELFTIDYLDQGLIDSFQVVEMIIKIEDNFDIIFTPEDFESEQFRTLTGITELIKKCKE